MKYQLLEDVNSHYEDIRLNRSEKNLLDNIHRPQLLEDIYLAVTGR